MLGLGGSILALRAIEDSGSPTNVLWAWATFQVHLELRPRFDVKWEIHGYPLEPSDLPCGLPYATWRRCGHTEASGCFGLNYCY